MSAHDVPPYPSARRHRRPRDPSGGGGVVAGQDVYCCSAGPRDAVQTMLRETLTAFSPAAFVLDAVSDAVAPHTPRDYAGKAAMLEAYAPDAHNAFARMVQQCGGNCSDLVQTGWDIADVLHDAYRRVQRGANAAANEEEQQAFAEAFEPDREEPAAAERRPQ